MPFLVLLFVLLFLISLYCYYYFNDGNKLNIIICQVVVFIIRLQL